MNKSICDIINPECLLKIKCSEICEEVNVKVLERLLYFSFEECDELLFKKNVCPVCNHNNYNLKTSYNKYGKINISDAHLYPVRNYYVSYEICCTFCSSVYIYNEYGRSKSNSKLIKKLVKIHRDRNFKIPDGYGNLTIKSVSNKMEFFDKVL